MKISVLPLLTLIVLVLSACNSPATETPMTESPGAIIQPTVIPSAEAEAATELPASATPNILEIDSPDSTVVALDFVDQVCSAQWTTNATQLPCPGHLEDADGGYIEASDHTVLEGMVSVQAPLLIGLPGSGYPAGIGLFGRYPPFLVYPGDTFQATIACQGDAECNLDFALEYYDQWGNYQATSWKWDHQAGEGSKEIRVDLSSLAGQTVEFTLVLRQEDELAGQWGTWIQPYIFRDLNAEPLAPQAVTTSSTPDPDDKTPGVISGMVDMSSAPPYLTDSMSGGSSPVAVVFFNQTDGTYWWIHTSLTGHPYYQMTVSPGEYQIVAYAQGVADVPYVAGGYTGQNPSCGKDLKTVTMEPNGRLENIIISDWNWTCGGTAYRPDKPADVPLP